jgi:hypothetical protein
VVNIARYYYHKTVYMGSKENNIYMGSKENNIYNNIYKGLNIIKATNYKLKDLIIPLRLAGVKISIKKGRSFNKKRLSSYINAPLPPSKCIYLNSPPKDRKCLTTLNRVH